MATYVPISTAPNLYMNGLGLSNSATTPNTLLNVATGQCRDSTNTFDMTLSTAVVVNTAVNGINGLDTGTIAASTVYAVILVSDPVSANVTGAMLSLSSTAPLMPAGYSAFRVVGFCTINASSQILPGQWTAGNTSYRKFAYETRQATAITAGAATSYTAIDLSTLVPSGIAQLPVNLYYAFTPGAASRTLNIQGFNRASGGSAINVTGQVSAVVISGNAVVIAELNAGASNKPEVSYKVANGADAAAISVAGYELSL